MSALNLIHLPLSQENNAAQKEATGHTLSAKESPLIVNLPAARVMYPAAETALAHPSQQGAHQI